MWCRRWDFIAVTSFSHILLNPELHTRSASGCTTSVLASLHVIYLTSCSKHPLESHRPGLRSSSKTTSYTTPCCVPNSESRLSLSSDLLYGTLFLHMDEVFQTLTFLKTSLRHTFWKPAFNILFTCICNLAWPLWLLQTDHVTVSAPTIRF